MLVPANLAASLEVLLEPAIYYYQPRDGFINFLAKPVLFFIRVSFQLLLQTALVRHFSFYRVEGDASLRVRTFW